MESPGGRTGEREAGDGGSAAGSRGGGRHRDRGDGHPALAVWFAGAVTVTTLSMVKATVLVPVKPSESVAWTVAEYDPAVVGVPETTPAGERARPGGREPPVTDQPGEMVAPPPAPEVVAASVSGVMAVPELSVCGPGVGDGHHVVDGEGQRCRSR